LYHLLFIDNPTGTGFSLQKEFVTDQDEMARDLYQGLQNFFDLHPQFLENDFYIAGESYGLIFFSFF